MGLSQEEQLRAQEVLKLFDEIDNLTKDLKQQITLEDLKLTKKYLNKKISMLTTLKKAYFQNDKFAEYEKCKEEIIAYKNRYRTLKSFEQEYITKTSETIKKLNVDKIKHTINNILMLDFYFSKEDKELFSNYLEDTDYFKRIEILYKLREIYLAATYYLYRRKKKVTEEAFKIISRENGIDGKLKKNKKEFFYLLSQDRYKELKDKVRLIKEQYNKSKRFLEELEKLIKYENFQYKSSIPKKIPELEDTNYKEIIESKSISDELIRRLENIKDGKYIRKYGLGLEKFIPKEITTFFADVEKLDDEALEEFSLLGIDVSKNKLKSLKKGQNCYDDVERAFLKKIIKRFEKIRPIEVYTDKKDTTIYYEILNCLVDNDNNFSYIEKLIEEIPLMKESRKDDKHIIINLIDKFILNYKLKLANQGFNYIEPNFYKEIIKCFYKNNVVLTDEEEKLIQTRLDEFLEYATTRKYASLKNIKEDVDELKTKRSIEKSSIDKEKISQELKFLDISKDSVISKYLNKQPIYVSNNTSSVFMIKGINNCCFSIDYKNYEDITFGIHFLDTSKLIDNDSEIIKSALEEKSYLPKLQMNEYEPVMSFTYHFKDFRHITDLRFSKGLVYVDKMYDENDIDKYRDKEDLKNMYIFINNFKSKDNINNIYTINGIKEVLFNTLGNDLKRKFYNYKIPFIYERCQEEADDLIRLNHNAICDKLSKIPKEEAHKIFRILDEKIDKYYVPDSNNANVVFDSSTFLGYYLMFTINMIMSGKYDIDKESENLKVYLEKLNSKRAYLPANIIKSNENKIKRIVRRYKKR